MQNQIEQTIQMLTNKVKSKNGNSYFTIESCGQLLGVSEFVIRDGLKKGSLMDKCFSQEWNIELSEFYLGGDEIDTYLFPWIAKYYASFASNYCTELAQQVDIAITVLGIRSWAKEQLDIND